MVVFTQPTSPKRTNCQIVLPRVFSLEVARTCVLFASPVLTAILPRRKKMKCE